MTEPTPAPISEPAGRGRAMLGVGLILVLAAIGVLVYAFTGGPEGARPPTGSSPESTTVVSTAPSATSTSSGDVEPIPLDEFDEAAVTITGSDGDTCTACLLLANTPETRQQGLMEVTDPALGGFDGMVFRYDDPVDGAFWMRNTPLPLSIAFFDEAGAFVSSTDMAPCPDATSDADCPRYPADAPFTHAIEVPQGGLADLLLVEGSTLRIDPGPCPLR